MALSPSQVIVLATPVFLLLIALEYAWGVRRRRNTYRLDDAINSIGLGMLSQLGLALAPLLRVGIYTALFTHAALWRHDGFWLSWTGWVLALVFYDFCYYWQHRASHEVAVLWAAHVVHHQSQHYNLSTALRQPGTAILTSWIFYVPMALAGVPPLVFGVVALIDLLYQFWVHTEHVPKLGWFDRWFCSPSNHRVHHGANDRYLDRNHGGILIVWDRLFGTFQEEDEPAVYGTRVPLDSWDPLWANAEVYAKLARDSWHTRSWADKIRVWVKPPGWRPADVAQRFLTPAFDPARLQPYRPDVPRRVQWFGAAQFAALLGATALYLWHVDRLALPLAFTWLCALVASLWALGAVLQGRIGMLEVLAIEAGALATASSVAGVLPLHLATKPLALALLVVVAWRAHPPGRFRTLLVAALACSLAGDVLLMPPDRFIPGLASFLLAHIAYIALFARGVPLLPSRKALAGTLAAAFVMVATLWPHLGPVLKIAVPLYALAIALMAAQAIGRALVLRDAASAGVAAGAVLFMLSDSLLAINRFATPLPLAGLWVLASYYAAQVLIVRWAREPAGHG